MACIVPVVMASGNAAVPHDTCGHDQPASYLDFPLVAEARDAMGFGLNDGMEPTGHPPSGACEVACCRQGYWKCH